GELFHLAVLKSKHHLSTKQLSSFGFRAFAVDVVKGVFLSKLGDDEPPAGFAHDVRIARQRRNGAAGELRALAVTHVETRGRLEDRLGAHKTGILRDSGDV